MKLDISKEQCMRMAEAEGYHEIGAGGFGTRRQDLAEMLNAWHFWGELDATLQSDLLDCIEHVYRH